MAFVNASHFPSGTIPSSNQNLTKKSKDNATDTIALESQIDQLVYQLYELTEEEIKIIENA
ncbi:hypothetical protein ACFQ2C_16355 [Sphingobacterium daejeonense]|uniref:Site-specific DNA-methyltransferase (adenine-specific) n=1 Tax=Sphingobacterium daejeonense TaxID=371142 RepID=A0ABW3RQU1_9SPHI